MTENAKTRQNNYFEMAPKARTLSSSYILLDNFNALSLSRNNFSVANNGEGGGEEFQTMREKGRDPNQSFDKSPHTHRTVQTAMWQHKNNATKNFNYTTIADRLRTVS